MPNLPKTWKTIALYSDAEGKYVPAPGARISLTRAALSDDLQAREISISGRKVMQVRAK